MPFKKVVCWKQEMLPEVMDTEALQVKKHIFLATHHPVKMYRRQQMHGRFSDSAYDEASFLQDFLARPNFIFVPILGTSGTGKSHLVRWLYANIPKTKTRRVLLIPKAETNLRKIISQILEGMTGEKFDDYRRRLEQATGSLGEGEAREMLLNNIALSVGPNGPHRGTDLNEYQEYIVEELPNLLHDPLFRRHLLQDGGIIHRLTVHILGNLQQVERIEERRGFTVDDLPLNVTDFQRAGELARNFYSLLIGDEELQTETVQWLNQNLDEAIARVLSFNGEDLFSLMLDVRESLADQNMELIILIEDFAKLQGIDKQLLEALLVQPDVIPNRKLCVLRSAVAMTTGYFEPLAPTVQTRVQFLVNLDVETGANQEMVQQEDIELFAARYLNAVRLSNSELMEWYNRIADDGDLSEQVPSACMLNECSHQQQCHEAFGSAGGYGLYPFNSIAIRRMLEQVSGKLFNPRLLLKDVLRHTIESYSDHLARGEFPPPQLENHFAGPILSANVERELQKDMAHFARRKVLLKFWSMGDRVVNLHPFIHEAFALPPLGGVADGEKIFSGGGTAGEEPAGQGAGPGGLTLPERLEKNILLLDQWSNGNELPQTLTQTLRELIFNALSNYIDWDGELMGERFFRGNTGLFRQAGVNFRNQSTQLGAPGKVQLIIPLEGDSLAETAFVLQGLLKYQYYGNWNYPEGPTCLRLFAGCLEKWANHLLKQLRSPLKSGEQWDPVPAVVELLALGNGAAGLPTLRGEPVAQVSTILQQPPETGHEQRSTAWKSLIGEYISYHNALKDILLTRISCTKGGSSNVKVIDAAAVLHTLQGTETGNWLTARPPGDLRSEYNALEKMQQKFLNRLDNAMEEEKRHCLRWLKKMHDHLGNPINRQGLANRILQAMEEAQQAGVFSGNRAELEKALWQFNTDRFDQCLSAVSGLEKAAGKAELLSKLGAIDPNTMATAERFVDLASRFLTNTEIRVKSDINKFDGGEDYLAVKKEIEQALADFLNLAAQLKG